MGAGNNILSKERLQLMEKGWILQPEDKKGNVSVETLLCTVLLDAVTSGIRAWDCHFLLSRKAGGIPTNQIQPECGE